MSNKNMKNKTVVFNMSDPEQQELYNYIQEQDEGFSTLVKNLLQQQKLRSSVRRQTQVKIEPSEMPRPSIYEVAMMKRQKSNA